MTPTIAIAFALVAGLLLWFVIGSRGPWVVKLGAIVVTCSFTYAVWSALDSFSGWATREKPPARALLVATAVDEPHAIYVWLVPPRPHGPLAYRPDTGAPRAYRLPYTRALHEQVSRGSALARGGRPVELVRQQRGTSGHETRFVVRRYQPPPLALPRKDAARSADAP